MSDIFDTTDDGGMMLTLDAGEVESSDELYSGNYVSKEGYYHVVANGWELKRDEGKLPQLKIDFTILDGTGADGERAEDQIDKGFSHRIWLAKWQDKESGISEPLDEKAQKGIRAFAYAFGLLTEAELSKPNVKIPFHMIEGRQAVVRVQKDDDWTDSDGNSRKGSLKIKWNNDAWPVTHERVKDVHKDSASLAMIVGDGVSDADLADI